MNGILKYGLITILILIVGLFVAYGIFINTFDLFGEPKKEILKTNCDYEGIRQATIYEYGGNAVTIPSINVSIDLGCTYNPDERNKKVIFTAEYKSGTTIKTEWKTFDTLKVIYSDKLEPITKIDKVTYSDSTLNLTIEYKEK